MRQHEKPLRAFMESLQTEVQTHSVPRTSTPKKARSSIRGEASSSRNGHAKQTLTAQPIPTSPQVDGAGAQSLVIEIPGSSSEDLSTSESDDARSPKYGRPAKKSKVERSQVVKTSRA